MSVRVEMKSGRWWFWIRRQVREFGHLADAHNWIVEVMQTRRWYRYRLDASDGGGMGGGNF